MQKTEKKLNNDKILLNRLVKAIGIKECKRANNFANYIIKEARKKDLAINNVNILLGYGGGKDSSWALVFTRLTQLICRELLGATFRLQIITMVHLGAPKETLKNINLVFNKLGLLADKRVICKYFCYNSISNFSKNYKIQKFKKTLLREDILMAGHLSQGNPRPTFCYTCNLHMLSAFISQIKKDTHFIITGDSNNEIGNYKLWIKSILNKLNFNSCSFLSILKKKDKIKNLWSCFFRGVLPSNLIKPQNRYPKFNINDLSSVSFLPVFNFTDYESKNYLSIFKKFLKFDFSKDALNFTESDCRHPLLMCHLHGIKTEIKGGRYSRGINEYLKFVTSLMKNKGFTDELINKSLSKYNSSKNIIKMRKIAESYSLKSLGIAKNQLICMVYSPIVNRGARLEKYLKNTAPSYLKEKDKIRDYLSGKGKLESDIKKFLFLRTGLNDKQLKFLFSQDDNNKILKAFSFKDPYVKKIKNKCFKNKRENIISGR